MSTSALHFIIGIDFGTTYSAAAWALVSDPKQAVELVKKWPTTGGMVGAKVPTEIAYSEDRKVSWGYNIDPHSRKIKWFKLGLETTPTSVSLPSGMDFVNLARDYLREIHTHAMLTLERRYTRSALKNARYDFVVTVPAIWSDLAKKRTESAAVAAGLGGTDHSSLELFSEPESAAVYALRTIDNFISRLKPGNKIVVCDAGGGTVDLISYEIKQLDPILQLTECTTGSGDFCGGSFIDREFEHLLEQRLGPAYGSLSTVHRQQILKSFEMAKMAFRNDASQTHFSIHLPNVLNDNQLQVSHEEMQALFDPVINKILKLIQEQIEMASENHNDVTAILLVGGFGESEYLYHKTKEWADLREIAVLQPEDASTAVVQGAVLKGLAATSGNRMQLARRARLSYGVPTKAIFVPYQHQEMDAVWDPNTGKKMADNQIHWFIKTNQIVDDEAEFRFSYRRTFKSLTIWEDTLVASPSAEPPSRKSPSVENHCTIISDLTHLHKSNFTKERRRFRSYYVAEYELVVSLRNNNLNLSLVYRGQRYGVNDVKFEAGS